MTTRPIPCEHLVRGVVQHPRGHCPHCGEAMRIALVASWPYCSHGCRRAAYEAQTRLNAEEPA